MNPRPILLIALALALWPNRGVFPQTPSSSAGDKLQHIRDDLKRTHAANDTGGYLAAAKKNAEFLSMARRPPFCS